MPAVSASFSASESQKTASYEIAPNLPGRVCARRAPHHSNSACARSISSSYARHRKNEWHGSGSPLCAGGSPLCHSEERSDEESAFQVVTPPSPPVIPRSAATKNLLFKSLIHHHSRSFAPLSMTTNARRATNINTREQGRGNRKPTKRSSGRRLNGLPCAHR